MKKVFLSLILAVTLLSCGSAYNNALKQVELGMSSEQIVSMMGEKYSVVEYKDDYNKTLEYTDKFKNNWFFQFVDGKLYKWYKTTE